MWNFKVLITAFLLAAVGFADISAYVEVKFTAVS